ncbi:MAG: transcriptional regulator [Sulfobacillus benefaciens]|uniref:Transcriptional regulator n=1 Tax=Sulfobacillus benefaciens TaxID=453960 RepID=A0A2T2XFJ9_9FIRM|nr:MAG: transcriptional regulator [Sulfobacillus benefaciens]
MMDLVKIFRALGHEVRYALFMQLITGAGTTSCCDAIAPDEAACCVVDFTRTLPLSQSTISHHLHILSEAGLVTQERRGTYSIYAVNEQALVALQFFLDEAKICRGIGSTHPIALQPDL